jgi:uncharacterized protein YjbI with pentapeptide repeats
MIKRNQLIVLGKYFSQESLPLDLRNISCGQPDFLNRLTCTVVIFAVALAGVFSGLFSAQCGRIAFADDLNNPPIFTLTLLAVLLTVSFTWIWNCVSHGFTSSLLKLLLLSFVLTCIAGIVSKKPVDFIIISFLFNLLAISCITLSLLCCVFSLLLADSLLKRKTVLEKRVIALGVITVTIFVSYQVNQEFPKGTSFPQDYYAPIKMLLGAITGSLIALVGIAAVGSSEKIEKNLKFLRTWATTLSSHGGTSFYNLNLSRVDFSGANLANSDFRASSLYRTILKGVTGLELARVDSRYLDLENFKVQQLLTKGSRDHRDFQRLRLQGAYLQATDLREFDFTEANLTGADLSSTDLRCSRFIRTQAAGAAFQSADVRNSALVDANLTDVDFRGADLRDSVLARAQVARTDFTKADLTGICIEDWSVSSKTCFTDVRCDYIYRKYQDGQPSDRYPADRDFEPGEFATLFAEPEDIVELVFKGEFDYAALSLALYKLQAESSDLDLELKGIEQRGNLWVVKVKSGNHEINERLVRERLSSVYQGASHSETVETTIKDSIYRDYEETRNRLAESERLVRQLAGVSEHQAEALKEMTKKSLGNNFFISGSTITNLAGSGQIEYREAADRVRSIVTNRADVSPTMQQLFSQLSAQNVATTPAAQQELIQQILLSEAEQDPAFRQFLLEQGQQIMGSLPNGEIAIALQNAIAQLKPSQT